MTGEVFFDFNLDFGNVSMPKRLRLTQYSDRLPTLRAKLYNVGAAYTIPDGATVNVRWKKPSGTVVYNPVTSATGNVITYALDGQCAAAAGTCSVCFEITTGGKTAQTPVFPVEVVANPVQDGDIEDSPEFGALEKAIADAEEKAKSGFEEAVEMAKSESYKISAGIAQQVAEEAAANVTEDARNYANQASESAEASEKSAIKAEEAALRAEAAAPVEGAVVSVNGMGGIVKLRAEKIPFDNIDTPFVSTTVQDAIKELLIIGGGSSQNSFSVDFASLDNLDVTGVWNTEDKTIDF